MERAGAQRAPAPERAGAGHGVPVYTPPEMDDTAAQVGLGALGGEEWQAVVDSLPQRLFVVDARHRVVVDNRAVRRSARGSIVGRACHEALHGHAEPCPGCPTRELVGLPVRDEGAELPPCGLIRCSPLRAADGSLLILVAETTPAELVAAGASAPMLSRLFHNSVDAVIAADPEGTILVFNEEAERILGHEAGRVVGQMHLSGLFPEGGAREVVRMLGSVRHGGKGRLSSCPASMRRADGATVPVVLRASTLYDGDGELATLWFVQDATTAAPSSGDSLEIEERPLAPEKSNALERLAARITSQVRSPLSGMFLFSNLLMQQLVRRELHRADAFLWNLIQGSVDAIIAADMKGNIFIFNDEAERILGYRTEEVVGRAHISTLYPIEAAREVMRKLRSEEFGGKGKLLSHDMTLRHKEGGEVPVRLKASIVYVNGVEFASVGFFQDQRDRLKMREDLERAQVQLLQSEKMASLGKLAAGIAHQINNPLSGIVLFSNLLLENSEVASNEAVENDLRRIAEDAQRCSAIVKELLEFARQTQDKVKAVDLSRALSQTIFLLEKQPLFQNIEVVKELSEVEPVVHGEPQQLNHVFMNLILNAAEAMDGRGTLTLRTREVPGEEAFEVDVADTGMGIPPEIVSRVFEPFFTTKEVGKGTGLGLSVVYGIVERHNGRIRIDSVVGSGTTFTVTLPIGSPPPE